MGLFDRFKRVFKSNLNDIISKAENPEKMLNQLIVDMNQQLVESKKTVASSIADEKRLERQVNDYLSQGQEWERRAVLALKQNRDDLAKEALVRKQESDAAATQLKGQLDAQHASVEKLKDSLRQLHQKIEEAQRKKNLLIARAKRAEAQRKIQTTMGGLADTSAFEAFDRMAAKVDQLEAEADALIEMDSSLKDTNLEEKFKALEASAGNTNADRMLEDLKKKLLEMVSPPPEIVLAGIVDREIADDLGLRFLSDPDFNRPSSADCWICPAARLGGTGPLSAGRGNRPPVIGYGPPRSMGSALARGV
ncbi:MAG: PspA/IM30 family protein [Candidatus Competibacteraceae bacterium]|nr:PspA/IM30 family protein [Candidatus Competibacteraceae bacterium]